MPEQLYPPFADDIGGSMSPRQLNRWLDVSPQGGALKRTEGYLTLPAFDFEVDWKGYSEIIGAFNFSGTHNFVLTDFSSAFPDDTNYALFIAYQQAGVVYRYKLCGPEGVFYFTTINYSGQTMKKNFRLEVWSVEDAPVSQEESVTFYTSVKGSFDYRFASDFELTALVGTIIDFQSARQPQAIGAYTRLFDSTTLTVVATNVTAWADVQATINLTPTGTGPDYSSGELTFDGPNFHAAMTGNFAPTNTDNQFYLTFKLNDLTKTGILMGMTNIHTTNISAVNDTITINTLGGTLTSSALEADKWYVLFVDFGKLAHSGVVQIFDAGTLNLVWDSGFFIRTNTDYSAWQSVKLGENGGTKADFTLKNTIVGFNTTTAINDPLTVSYMAQLVGPLWALPLTFPSNSSVLNNT